MNPSNHTSPLDAFISDALKGAHEKFQPVDWSEVQVLLKYEQRSIPVTISRKNVFTALGAIGAVLLIFGIYQISQYSSSLPAETESPADSSLSLLQPIDTPISTAADTVAMKRDIIKTDSTAMIAEKRKADSLASIPPKDTVSIKASTAKVLAPVVKPVLKADKKKKKDSLLTQPAPDTAAKKIVADTASQSPPKELVSVIPAVDTSSKKPGPENNSSKKKRSKKKTSPATEPTPVAKPDSVKQP